MHKGSMVKGGRASRSGVFGAVLAAGLVAMFGGSQAFAAGMADGVVGTITGANADVVLIGTAILALCVLIASISWFKRATNK